ncbi:MAG: alpha/beta hydrolase [Gammaproteobacteria bacterium]|nr:alpha/beta hydrolase [Gammaproteobacteria bacterium]
MVIKEAEQPRWLVPEALAVVEATMEDGTGISIRRHGNPDGTRIVLSHANGLASDAYYPFWSLLEDRFDLMVYDFRNHGWNSTGSLDAHSIPTFVSDNERVAETIEANFGAKPRVGVFHSLSGQTAAFEATQIQGAYSALVLFDPFFCPPGCDPQHKDRLERTMDGMVETARRRRTTYESTTAYADRMSRSPAFERLRPGVTNLIAEATLRRAAEEPAFELRCPPEYEAKIYEQGRTYASSVEIGALSCPVKVIGSDPVEPHSFLPTVAMDEIIALNYDFIPETTHFLQLEEPEECVAAMIDFIAKVLPNAQL